MYGRSGLQTSIPCICMFLQNLAPGLSLDGIESDECRCRSIPERDLELEPCTLKAQETISQNIIDSLALIQDKTFN